MIKKKTIKDLTREELIKELEIRGKIIKLFCQELAILQERISND